MNEYAQWGGEKACVHASVEKYKNVRVNGGSGGGTPLPTCPNPQKRPPLPSPHQHGPSHLLRSLLCHRASYGLGDCTFGRLELCMCVCMCARMRVRKAEEGHSNTHSPTHMPPHSLSPPPPHTTISSHTHSKSTCKDLFAGIRVGE